MSLISSNSSKFYKYYKFLTRLISCNYKVIHMNFCTYNVYIYVVPVQGSPARSDLCFPKWVAACWADPDLGDTRATLKDTRKRHKTKTQDMGT